MKIILFDFDLTLADSAKPIIECIRYALHVSHLPVPEEKLLLATIGMSLTDAFSLLAPGTPPEALIKHFGERADQIMVEWTKLYKEVFPAIKDLHDSGYKLGIVSAKYRFRMEAVLRRENMLHYFDIIIGKEDVVKQKPDPEGIFKAIYELESERESVVYIGDSFIDARTAAAAGVKFIGVTTGVTSKTDLLQDGAIAVIKDLSQLIPVLNRVSDKRLRIFQEKDLQIIRDSFIKGPLQMLFSALAFTFMALFAKLAAAKVSGAEIAFIRFSFGVIAVLILALFRKVDLNTSKKGLLVARGIFGGGAVLLYMMALATGSMTNSTVLNNTYPIFAIVLAAIVLKEKITSGVGLSFVIAWIGVGLLIHPDIHHLFWPDLLGLGSGVLAGFAITIVRELRKNNESSWNIFFYLSLFGLLGSFVFAAPDWVWPDWITGIYLLLAAVFGLIGQITMTSAFKYCNTAVGGVLSMTTMVFTAFLGIFGLGENLKTWELAGAVLITLGSVLIVWLTNRVKSTVT